MAKSHQRLHDLVDEAVELYPDSVACLWDDGETVQSRTYKTLDLCAKKVKYIVIYTFLFLLTSCL